MKILEVCKVTPPSESTTDVSLSLTFFDLFWLRTPPVSQLFFYKDPLVSTSSLVPKLKNSLSLTLKHFLPLSGNLEWSHSSCKPIIRYEKGDGVSLTVAESNADFDHLSSNNIRECKSLHPFVALLAGSGSLSPLLAVKLTVFPYKGFCIGITNHHAIFDGMTFSFFLKTWASVSKFGEKTELTPVFDREFVRERFMEVENLYTEILGKQNGDSMNKLLVWEFDPPSPDTVCGTFVLPDVQVKKLKDLVNFRYVSTFTVTYAYVILCLLKSKKKVDDMVRVVVPYDCRARLEPPLTTNYVGNCVGSCRKNFNNKDLLGSDGFMVIINFIITSIKGLDSKLALREAEEWLPSMIKSSADTNLTKISVEGSSKFGLQSVDFGWGKPQKMDITSIHKTGAFVFTEVEDAVVGKGMEVQLCLSKGEMENFASLFAQGLSKLMKHGLASL